MENHTRVPIWIKILSWSIRILKTEDNIADGHIEKFKFVESQKNTHRYRDRVNTCRGGYNGIYEHIADDWFKEIGKWPEGPWTCQ